MTSTFEIPESIVPSDRALVAAPVGIFETDVTGGCLFVNDRWCELAGLTRAQALGQGWLAAIHPDDRERVDGEWAAAVQGRRDFDLEYRFRRPDGEVVWLAGSASAIRDEADVLTGFVGTVTNVSSAIATREALVEQRRFLDAVLDIAGSLVCVMDPEGRFLRFNRACEVVSGYSFEEIRGQPFYEFLIPTEEVEEVRAALVRLRAGEPPTPNTNSWIAKDGAVRLISWSNTCFFDDGGSLTHVVSTGTDITDERIAQEALKERARLFAAANAFAHAANSTLESDLLIPVLLEAIGAALPADVLGLVVLDRASGRYVVRAVHGALDGAAVGTVIPVGEGVSGRAIARGTLILERVDRASYARGLAELVAADTMAFASVPLLRDGTTLGAIVLGRVTDLEPAFTAMECEALSLVASQTALALANAHLLEEVSELAIRDGLTGLYNRRHLDASLEQLLHRRARGRAQRPPLAAIMFDLDYFGHFNKEHGHQAGDAVLRAFAEILEKRFRSNDLVARYGGEEFVVVLEGSTVEDATRAAEEVRRSLEAHSISGPLGIALKATVSAGCAALDDAEPTGAALLRTADVGLFMAKRSGRNAVVAV